MVGSSVSEDSSNPLHLSLSWYYWNALSEMVQQLLLLQRGYFESYKVLVHMISLEMYIHVPYNLSFTVTVEKWQV